ncbi:hypothetical protein [Acetobacter sp.]|uniref:hypothetical protein n=1 Tax=Acetobacter sp. TaxID=440 RepID=UPI0039E8F0A3
MDERSPENIPVRSALHYALGAFAGAGVLLFFYVGMIFVLKRTGNLPPPPLSNSLCIDEKLKFLRENSDISPTVLITGSSVAWRSVNSALLQHDLPKQRIFNGALCGQKANQTASTTDWLLKHYSSIRTIVMLAVPQDFTLCRNVSSTPFSLSAADEYVFGKNKTYFPLRFYFQFFDPISLQHNAHRVASQRRNEIPLDPLVITSTGDGPLNTVVSRTTLGDGPLPPYDPVCYNALNHMEQVAKDKGLRFVVALLPVKQAWEKLYDPSHQRRHELVEHIKQDFTQSYGEEVDLESRVTLPEGAFTDAVHIRWSAVPVVTEALSEVLRNSPHLRGANVP